jgi:hypothetical protein
LIAIERGWWLELFQEVDPDTVKRKLRFDYMKARNEASFKSLDMFTTLLAHFEKPQISIRDMIQEATQIIQKQFRLRWVMIGLKSSADGKYRYEVHTGMRDEAWKRQSSKYYKYEDFNMTQGYIAGEISKLSRVYLEEDNPLPKEDEIVTNRPALLRMRRKLAEDTLEADFIDTLIVGPNNDLLGWIEYPGTLTGKFPDPLMIRYIEVIASIIAAAIHSGAR